MSQTYPVIDARALERSQRRGPFGLMGARRDSLELPRPAAHHMLVYRVNGDYVEGGSRLRPEDDAVTDATHVSVVDMSRDTEVVVQFTIPSRDAGVFTASVTFACTVTDAVIVVRDGVNDVRSVLRSYLRTHGRTHELGLMRSISDINEMRKDVRAEIEAYTTIRPPAIPGMMVRFVGADVTTPEEIVELEARRRSINQTRIIEADQERADQDVRTLRQRNTEEFDDQRRRHDQQVAVETQLHGHVLQDQDDLARFRRETGQQQHDQAVDDRRQRYERLQAARQLQYEQDADALRREFARRELRELREVVGDRPEDQWALAAAAGQLSAREHAELLAAERERREATERAEAERVREVEERERADARTDRLRELEWQREERLLEHKWSREKEGWEHERQLRQADREREDRLQTLIWQREDMLRHEKSNYETQRRRLEINLEVLRELAQRGHIDTVNLDLERFVSSMVETAPPPADPEADELVAHKADALPSGGHEERPDTQDDEPALREENAY